MAIYRGQKGNKLHLIIGKRETLRILILTATRAPPRFTNRQTMMTAELTVRRNMPFEGTLMGFSISNICLLSFPDSYCLLNFLICP